ncbi:MAG: Branched-chain-amino-acid aminotransferase-like protein 2, partial [uncultured Rubrobacteraceae bacterium]
GELPEVERVVGAAQRLDGPDVRVPAEAGHPRRGRAALRALPEGDAGAASRRRGGSRRHGHGRGTGGSRGPARALRAARPLFQEHGPPPRKTRPGVSGRPHERPAHPRPGGDAALPGAAAARPDPARHRAALPGGDPGSRPGPGGGPRGPRRKTTAPGPPGRAPEPLRPARHPLRRGHAPLARRTQARGRRLGKALVRERPRLDRVLSLYAQDRRLPGEARAAPREELAALRTPNTVRDPGRV